MVKLGTAYPTDEVVFFTRSGYELLEVAIRGVEEELTAVGRDIGESVASGGDTFHDNFDFDEGTRMQRLLHTELAALRAIRAHSVILEGDDKRSIDLHLGKHVVMEYLDSDGEIDFVVGDYLSFQAEEGKANIVSYKAPLAIAVKGRQVGDEVIATIKDENVKFVIIGIT